MDRMNRIEEMMSDECGMMNEEGDIFHSSFITPHSSFSYPAHPVHPC
jgi:hypothetical protein